MQKIDAVQRCGPVGQPGIPAVAGHPVVPAPSIVPERGCDKRRNESWERPRHGSSDQTKDVSVAEKPVRRSTTKEKVHPASPQLKARPHSVSVSRRTSTRYPFIERDIPLYLVPHIIARGIWQRGEQVYRISVIRTKQHFYTIRVRTKRPKVKSKKRSRGKESSLKT